MAGSNGRLVAALACRNQGSRLYGKPVQNLDLKRGVRIVDHILDCLNSLPCIKETVLGIAEGIENEIFKSICKKRGIRYIIGDQVDVLSRLIQCGRITNATDIFRVTSESPFLYFEQVEQMWGDHQAKQADASFMDDVIDGCGFEIISLKALEESHVKGGDRHRSELCSLYIRDNLESFKVIKGNPPVELVRRDLRLTVDNPEDLAVCRAVYTAFRRYAPRIPLLQVVKFLDANEKLKDMVAQYTEAGYVTMYQWGSNEQ